MRHLTLPRFWQHYQQLPKEVQGLADKNYALLKVDPQHASLHFKKVGKRKQLWSVRVGEPLPGARCRQARRHCVVLDWYARRV
jgi:hypothetical protein